MRAIVFISIWVVAFDLCVDKSEADIFLGVTSDPNVKFISASPGAVEGTYPILIEQPGTKGLVTGNAPRLLVGQFLPVVPASKADVGDLFTPGQLAQSRTK